MEQPQTIDLNTQPDLLRLVDDVATTRQPLRLQRDGKDVAEIRPAPKTRRLRTSGRALTLDDPLFHLIGIGESLGPGDISANKHEYLVKGHLERHRR